jgi:hypothetical protein
VRSDFELATARRRHWLRALGIVLAGSVLAWQSAEHHRARDVSAASRHTLAAASHAALAALKEPVTATLYVPDTAPQRRIVAALVARYQELKPDLRFVVTDPAKEPERVRRLGLREGELVLEAGERSERLVRFTEQDFTNSLVRLAGKGERWLAFVTGHGERSPQRGANFDVTSWADALRKRGLRSLELDLATRPVIPDNTAVLVIASPQQAYLPGEIALIKDYLARGGNLLWLREPDEPADMKALADAIGVARVGGTIVDPATQSLGVSNPAMAIVSTYREHPLTQGFKALTIFPYAAALQERPHERWTATRLFATGRQAWSEMGDMNGNVAYDAGVDLPGPLALGIALTHELPAEPDRSAREQRVVVLGDGDFISNAFLGNQGNLELGMRCVEWLAAVDALITIETRVAPDVALNLKPWHMWIIGLGFLFVLPLAFLANGFLLWWRRRRA